MTTKNFHIGDVLSITDGHLVSPNHIDGVYSILNWMTGESLMTHQLPRAMDECRPALLAQHPELGAVQVPGETINSLEDAVAFLEALYPVYGRYVPVAPLAPEDHTSIDPIAELKMIRPDLPILAIDTANDNEVTVHAPRQTQLARGEHVMTNATVQSVFADMDAAFKKIDATFKTAADNMAGLVAAFRRPPVKRKQLIHNGGKP